MTKIVRSLLGYGKKIAGESDVYSMHVRELTGSKLVLVDDIDEEGEGEVITYTKQ